MEEDKRKLKKKKKRRRTRSSQTWGIKESGFEEGGRKNQSCLSQKSKKERSCKLDLPQLDEVPRKKKKTFGSIFFSC